MSHLVKMSFAPHLGRSKSRLKGLGLGLASHISSRMVPRYFLLSIFSLRCLAQASAVLFFPWAEFCLLAE